MDLRYKDVHHQNQYPVNDKTQLSSAINTVCIA